MTSVTMFEFIPFILAIPTIDNSHLKPLESISVCLSHFGSIIATVGYAIFEVLYTVCRMTLNEIFCIPNAA